MKITLNRRLPLNLVENDMVFFQGEIKKEIDEPSILYVDDAYVDAQGVTHSKFKIVMESLIQTDQRRPGPLRLQFDRMRKKRVTCPDKGIPALVFDAWFMGYFHWITETLPRILFIQKNGSGFIPLIPFHSQLLFIEQSLQPFQLDRKIALKSTAYFFSKKLALVKRLAPTGNYNEDVMRELRKVIRRYFSPGLLNHGSERIYVSRQKSKRRRVVNERDVAGLLAEFDFITVHFEDMSFEQQVKVASNAKYLIGMHGAGLTNMLFMEDRTSVLEFRAKGDRTNLCYFALSSALGLQYYYQFGDPIEKTGDLHMSDLTIDLQLLRYNVELMLNRHP